MSRADLRRRRRLVLTLLAALAWAAVALPLMCPASPARAAVAPAAQGLPRSCGDGGSTTGSFFYTYVGPNARSETNLRLCATGRVTVTFAGDPATGCATYGLCGYAGTEVFQPEGFGQVSVLRYASPGRRYSTATMALGGGPGGLVTSSVQRSQPNGTTTACSDQDPNGIAGFSLPVSGGRVTVGLDHSPTPLLGTRCAGPLGADIAAALPSQTVALSRLLRGHDTIDLNSSEHFAAHGLAGTVSSTIVVSLGRPHRTSLPAPPAPGTQHNRVAEADYRVVHIGGSATAAVRSSPIAAVCNPFDSCGLQGVIDVKPQTTLRGSVVLTAGAPGQHSKRDLLAALGVPTGGNPSGIGVEGGGFASVRGTVSADLTQQQDACRDQVDFRGLALVVQSHAKRLDVALTPIASQTDDALRTRCPGPDSAEHRFTEASLPLTVLRHRTFTVALHGLAFSNGPYHVSTRSTLTVTLRREKVRTQMMAYAASAR